MIIARWQVIVFNGATRSMAILLPTESFQTNCCYSWFWPLTSFWHSSNWFLWWTIQWPFECSWKDSWCCIQPTLDPLTIPHFANIAGTSYFLSQHHHFGWIIDSGATDHMCHSLSSFTNLQFVTHSCHVITILDGRSITISHIGDVHLNATFVLKDVLFVQRHLRF